MMTLSSIISRARKAYGQEMELHYLHPTLYVVCKDPYFASLDSSARLTRFSERANLPADLPELASLASVLSLVLVTPEERSRDYDFLDTSALGEHWLPLFDAARLKQLKPTESSEPHAIHFYGYKGGQARSTVLAMLAQQLAEDGYKVLAVDADVEAPSLDVVLNTVASSPSQTLLGLTIQNQLQPIEPRSAYTAKAAGGCIDLLACRPSSDEYDMDAAAFALRTALDVTVLEDGLKRLRRHIENKPAKDRYDFVLFDHRSGLTTSVLPAIKAHAGPVVICLRIDEQSNAAGTLIDILFGQVKDTPGAYVSFSLDPEETRDKMLGRHSARINALLDRLGTAIERGSTGVSGQQGNLAPEDLQRYWVSWFHDRAFLTSQFPALSEIAAANRQALLQLREVLGFSGKKAPSVKESSLKTRTLMKTQSQLLVSPKLSPSGAGDEGIFIETQEITKLFQTNTSIGYIFGRKGTGKTRLLRELQDRSLGEPLIVAADSKGGGISSGDALFTDLVANFANSPEKLWWAILRAAIESESTTAPAFHQQLKQLMRRPRKKGSDDLRVSDVAEIAARLKARRVFLIDGIETAFRSAQLIEFVEALFKFLLTVQSDAQFADRIAIRLFLRTDLAKRAIQNVEQQTDGRRLDLTWNTQSIFNFVISRITQLEWFRSNFANACKRIDDQFNHVRAGLMEASEYEDILREIFPGRLRRNNLQTLTFLKTYFSDAAGDDETRAAFYPRLFDAFLRYIANPEELSQSSAPPPPIEDGRIHQSLVLAAHEAASRRFLDEVKQELAVLLDLAKRPADNEQRVNDLINAFDGLKTPFELEKRLKELRGRVSNVELQKLRVALQRMKEIGMFEDRPDYPGWWRAGRLFKSALRMKYVR